MLVWCLPVNNVPFYNSVAANPSIVINHGMINSIPDSVMSSGGYSFSVSPAMCSGADVSMEFRVKRDSAQFSRVKGTAVSSTLFFSIGFDNNYVVQGSCNSYQAGWCIPAVGAMVQQFNDWSIVKMVVQGNVVNIYINGVFATAMALPPPLARSKVVSFGFSGTGASYQIDWIKCYDGSNNLKYQEDFIDPYNFTKVPYDWICPTINCSSNFTSFYNNRFGTALTYSQIADQYKTKCGIYFEPCGPVTGPTLCGSPAIYTAATLKDLRPCGDSTLFSVGVGTKLFNAYQDSLVNSFNDRYLAKCLKARYAESFTVTAPISEFHYTLYYYDQAGNLVKTVPPAGVDVSKFGWAAAYSDSVKTARALNNFNTPAHVLSTQYRYNTLNQVVAQITPDAGISQFWYDRLGRLILSQNAKQKANSATELNALYSYTNYDYLGRIAEVGQVKNNNGAAPVTNVLTRSVVNYGAWLAANTATRSQVTQTNYDIKYAGFLGQENNTIWQRNLRNRVSYTSFMDTANLSSYNQASFYTYDIHGNVDTLLQDYGNASLSGIANVMNVQGINANRFKRMVYQYDLISGKVNYVAYQPPRGAAYYPDMFYHRYTYDAENRLTLTETSMDSTIWEKEARYDYYRHGPLARTTLGDQLVQGVDYAYTLQGWLKGVNATNIADPIRDMGTDGLKGAANQYVARDEVGFNLNYFTGDYWQIIGPGTSPFPSDSTYLPASFYKPLFNGNIRGIAVSINYPGAATAEHVPQSYVYSYDQLNRLTGMDVFRAASISGNSWFNITQVGDYKERVAYDANGNILKYLRQGFGSTLPMDSLSYNYSYAAGKLANNKLNYVRDQISGSTAHSSNYTEDIDDQSAGNYSYDAIGNLTSDAKEGITNVSWSVYGKIKQILRTATGSNPVTSINYTYDAGGNRICKQVTKGATDSVEYTWYVRDASGNIMSTYFAKGAAGGVMGSSNSSLVLTEQNLYGSSRIGVLNRNISVIPALAQPSILNFVRGNKFFELTNHLGNVLATVSDKKVPHTTDGTTVDYYNADVISAQDYYPFGMQMPGRKYVAGVGAYRYGFNGQEISDEINPNLTSAEFWEYDSRIGRRWNNDPRPNVSLSPYATFGNNPIYNSDPLGDTTVPKVSGGTMELSAGSFTTFDGGIKNLKGTSTTVQPAKGTVKSFTSGTSTEPLTFEATFGSKSGTFQGYFNTKNSTQSFDDYRNILIGQAHAMDVVDDFVKDGLWDRNISDQQAGKRALALGLGYTLPNPLLKYGTATANAVKATDGGLTNPQLVQKSATLAERAIGGLGGVAGTAKHQYASALLNRYQSIFGSRGLETGLYFNNGVGNRGFLDIIDHTNGIIYDFKFGSAVMKPAQYNKYFNNFGLPIKVIRPH